jgi:hypothetical protein
MVTQRSIGWAVVLSLITFGIYGIYWFIVLTNEVGRLSGDSSFTGGKHFLLSLITCGIWTYVWSYQLGKQIAEAQHQRGLYASDNSVLFFVLNSDVNKMV